MPPRRLSKKATAKNAAPKSTGVKSLRITMPTAKPAPAPAATTSDDAAKKPVTEDEVNKLSLADLTIDVPLRPFVRPRRAPVTKFHFLSLPSELRMEIYAYFFEDVNNVLDLDPLNYKLVHKKLALFRVCKLVHEEACYYFYSTRTFRLFSTHPGKFFKTKRPLLSRLKEHQRQSITSLELRLGPGWNAPPKGWVVNPALGLKDCADVQKLKVLVQCDPSDKFYTGFRRGEDLYEEFSQNLLTDILNELPSVHTIEFDAYSGVRKNGDMMQALFEVVDQYQLAIEWGPERGWTDNMDEDDEDPAVTARALNEGLQLASMS